MSKILLKIECQLFYFLTINFENWSRTYDQNYNAKQIF